MHSVSRNCDCVAILHTLTACGWCLHLFFVIVKEKIVDAMITCNAIEFRLYITKKNCCAFIAYVLCVLVSFNLQFHFIYFELFFLSLFFFWCFFSLFVLCSVSILGFFFVIDKSNFRSLSLSQCSCFLKQYSLENWERFSKIKKTAKGERIEADKQFCQAI